MQLMLLECLDILVLQSATHGKFSPTESQFKRLTTIAKFVVMLDMALLVLHVLLAAARPLLHMAQAVLVHRSMQGS